MKGLPEERAVQLAQYIIESNATVRQTAKKFNISKSTVHKDVTNKNCIICSNHAELFEKVKRVLEQNKAERHIRGGSATKLKYQKIHKIKKL